MKFINAKVCLTSSAGGHMHELLLAIRDLEFRETYWITYKTSHLLTFLADKNHHFVINTDSKNRLTWLINAIQSLWILWKERPDMIISTGAGVSYPTIFLGKKIFRCRVIYIVSAADVTVPSRTPLRAYPHSDLFLVQWPELLQIFPKANYIGVL